MPDPITVTLAAVLIEHQAKKTFGEHAADKITDALTEIVGEKALDKLFDFLGRDERANKLLEAFQEADGCFAETCGDDTLRQAIISRPLAALPSLEQLATLMPKTLDDAGLLAALRHQFANDWPRLSDERLDRAAVAYRNCLDRALAAKCDQLLPTLFRKVEHIEAMAGELLAGQRKIESLLVDATNLGQLGLPREWLRPSPPRPSVTMIGRHDELDAVCNLLTLGARAAITATVHGTPGVGKTLLAEHLAIQLDGQFPGGVLFERFGAGFRDAELTAPILNRWSAHAFGGRPLPEGTQFTSEAVRALLAGHGPLLAVLDDIWDLKAIQPLLEALPNDACVLITTRNERLARGLHGEVYSLDVLSKGDALALLRARVRKSTDADVSLLQKLANALGRHAQALDIAGGSLDRLSRSQWPAAVAEMARQVREGSGFGELRLPGDEETESRVEAALYFSYADLSETAQARFRALGAFALDASFRVEAATGVWDCPLDEAQGQLTVFVERGLLTRLADERWQQHSLLRSYALALLRRAGEEATGRGRHATVHLALMREADDWQVYYLMLPEYPQLRHAFDWAVEHDLSLAQGLARNAANLQEQFNLIRENHDWASRLVASTQDSSIDTARGFALVMLGNGLRRAATLPGEDRRTRLRESLAAYDDALHYYHADVAPFAYAITQSNRAVVLGEIASLAGEDRRTRLHEALGAFDSALQYQRPDVAPPDYARTQNNRGIFLVQIAELPGENRHVRLIEALAAFDRALQYRDAEAVPLDYAQTQNNRGLLLHKLADLPGEDRHARLYEALAAFDDALRYQHPSVTPLDYAKTQNNRGNLLIDIGALPGEDRHARLYEALAAFDDALRYYQPEVVSLNYAIIQNNRGSILCKIAFLPREDTHARLLEALAAAGDALQYCQPEVAPLDYAMIQTNLAFVFGFLAALPGEDPRSRLSDALRCAYTAYSFFKQLDHMHDLQQVTDFMRLIKRMTGKLFAELWAKLNVGEPPEWLTQV